jgi:hypothetical protein
LFGRRLIDGDRSAGLGGSGRGFGWNGSWGGNINGSVGGHGRIVYGNGLG